MSFHRIPEPPPPEGRRLGSARNNAKVKAGSPSDDELKELAYMLYDNWERLGRRLGFDQATMTVLDKENAKVSEKALRMLIHWRLRMGSHGTYQVLYDALCHKLVNCKRIAQEICLSQEDSPSTSSSAGAEERQGDSPSTEELTPKTSKTTSSSNRSDADYAEDATSGISDDGEHGEHGAGRKGSGSEPPSKGKKKPVSDDKAFIIDGTPELVDLERLSKKLGSSWEAVARRVEFEEEEINEFDQEYMGYANKAYHMLCQWKRRDGSKATYEVLYNALSHGLVLRRDLAQMFCLINDSIPSYVDDRDAKMQAAYARALAVGSTYDKRVKILIVGQDRVGKTSLGNFLRGEEFNINETSTAGVQMIPPIKNAGKKAWGNPDDTHVFDHKVTAEMAREMQGTPSKQSENLPQNETEEEKSQDQISDASKERIPGGEPLRDDALQGNQKKYVNEQGEVVQDIMSEEVKSRYEKRKTEDQGVSEDKIWPVIWDFAGQDIYRAIHPMFMSPEAIYLLVFDLTQELHDRAVCRVNLPNHKEEQVKQQDTEDTNLDHVMRWMTLIHALKNPDGTKMPPDDSVRSVVLPPSIPPVILVGTHADLVDPSKIDSHREQFQRAMKTLYDHVVHVLPVDNTKSGKDEGQENIVNLRTALLRLAENMPHTLPLPKNKIPLQWHRVEKELSKTAWQEKKYITKETFRQIASQLCNFRSKYDIDALIHFLDDRGSVVYHELTNDQDGFVFLDPQWLINMITQIINVNPLDGEAEAYERYRQKLNKKGILHKKLLDYGLQRMNLDPVKDIFISLMQRFNLICMWPSKDPQDPLILVPCMLTSEDKEEDQEDEMTLSTCCAPLYLKFEETNYVPGGLFCRLVVLFGKWLSVNPKEKHAYKLRSHMAQFSLDADYYLRLVCYKRVIELCILAVDSSPPKHCAKVLSFVEESMKTLQKECHWLLSMSWDKCVRCTICMGNNTKCCKLHNEKKCLHHDCGHYIPLKSNFFGCKVKRPPPRDALQRLQPWIDALQEKPGSCDSPSTSSSAGAGKRKGDSLSTGEPAPKTSKTTSSSNPSDADHAEDATSWISEDETKSRKTDSNPPEVDVTVLTNRELPKTSERLDLEQLPIDILLLTVKDCELLACLSLLTGFSRMFQKDLGDVYIGKIGVMKIAVMKCRMGAAGPGGAAGVVRDAVKALTPKAVFCVGYCWGLQPVKVKLGYVVISEVLITYAPSKVTKDGIEERGDRVPLKPNLAKVILNAAAGWSPPLRDPAELEVERVRRGALLSGPQVVDDNDFREALLNRFPGAIAIEMEGEGVYSAAHDLNVEWIIIKGVSDFADGKKSETNAWRPFASLMAASFVAHILSNPITFEELPHYNNGKTSLPPSSAVHPGFHQEKDGVYKMTS